MTESELLMYYREILIFNTQSLYAWYAVTFGLYSIAYVTGNRLRLGAVLFTILTYGALTSSLFLTLARNGASNGAIVEDLIDLQASGGEITHASLALIELASAGQSMWAIISFAAAIFLPAIGGISYLIFRYREGSRTVGKSDT